MLTCVCGAVLVSDQKYWQCPYEKDKNYHDAKNAPIRIPDKRVTTFGRL